MNYSNYKFSFDKYKNKTFIEVAKEIITKDEKYISIIGKTIVNPKISSEKKKEFQNFLEFFHNYFLKNKESIMAANAKSEDEDEDEDEDEESEIISLPQKNADVVIKQTNKTISHIIHISDIHIRLYNRQKEYTDIFQKLFQKIKEIKAEIPNIIIIITGDLLHSKNILSPESILITQQFLQKLSEITATLLIAGNHDALLTNNQREDSITAITKNIEIPNFHYLKYSGVYIYENLAIAVNSIIDNKWIFARDIQRRDTTTHTIALYHGPVGLCETGVGFRLRGEKLVDDFQGYDYALLGDIHKFQFLDPEGKRIAYASSLIAQNFSEWNHPHGLLLWDLFAGNHKYLEIPNTFGFFVFNLQNNQIFLEKDAVQLEDIPTHIQHLESGINLKLNINQCSPDFIASVNYVVKKTIRDARIIYNYITSDEQVPAANGNSIVQKGPNQFTMTHTELLSQYLAETYKSLKSADVEYIIEKYNQYHIDAEIANDRELAHWELVDIEFSNMFGYGANNYIDFSRFNSNSQSPIGIIAPNSHGKSSLIDIILFTLFTKFSRTRGTGVSKDIINIHCNNFKTKLNFKIGSEKYTILKEGKRELSDKIKITKNEFYKIGETGETIILTDEDRKKTDKVIQDLIGSYDDFIFTNVQLQNNTNSFKEMTDKERKEYLYKVLKLNVWNDIIKMISDITKPMRNTITFLEKSTENKSRDDYECKIKEIDDEMRILGEAIQDRKNEKDGFIEEMGKLRNNLGPNIGEKYDVEKMEMENKKMSSLIESKKNEIRDISCEIKESEEKMEGLRLIIREAELIREYEEQSKNIPPFTSTQNLRKKLKLKLNLEPEEIIKNNNIDKKEIDNLKKLYEEYYTLKIEYVSKLYKMTTKDENVLKIETSVDDIKQMLKAKTKELGVVNKKITAFNQEYDKYKMNEAIHKKYQALFSKKKAIVEFIGALESHEYDPKCIYCMKHPTVKQKMEKENELRNIEKEMKEICGGNLADFDFEGENDSYIQSMVELKEKLEEKKSKKIMLETSISKMELEIEKEMNILEKQEDIKNKFAENKGIQEKIDKLTADYEELQGRIKGMEEIVEAHSIAIEIVEIESNNKIRNDFEKSEIFKEWAELENERKMKAQYELNIANLKIKYNRLDYDIKNATEKIIKNNEIIEKVKDYEKIMMKNRKIEAEINNCEDKLREIEKEINQFNQKNGVLTQQKQTYQKEYNSFIKNSQELKEKKNECGLLQILEQSLGKDGLPLKILNAYLQPITDSINSIIAPFIPRKIKLHINNDDLILDSFTSSDSTKSVFIHGGMESFILDIAFKITLSNFAKLPKCNILFLDEGISAFDNERLSNIDMLFNFINRYFLKTILITHIDSIKENIQEKINIIKDEQYSKIVCYYN
jgi:DNA repair exonuclease SbcCD ATPase subunit/DNA repair exonuclease SbcCD nuclease subunit